jgi:dTDP-4-amino-4,6-dideoxygalactose transaminase
MTEKEVTTDAPIQMVDLIGQYETIRGEIDEAIRGVVESGYFIRGPQVGEFECKLAEYLDTRFVLGVGNGTDAIQIALMALGVGPGDEVVTPSFTFVATAEAAAVVGARPVFADIDSRTFNLDVASVESVLTPRTKVIVPVHLFGQAANMEPLMELAEDRGIAVLEDAAQAVGAQRGDRTVGGIGSMGTLSFFPSKNLGAFGDGGAVMTNDEDLYAKARMIANHGGRKKYFNEIVGLNSRLDTLQAAILGVKLRYLDRFTEARIAAADRYDELLSGTAGITTPFRDPSGTHVFHQYTIRVETREDVSRDGLAGHLRSLGIPCAVYYPKGLHELPAYVGEARASSLVETERASGEVLSLPMHTELSQSQQQRIAAEIGRYMSG